MDNNKMFVKNPEYEINEVDEKLVIFEPSGTKIYVLEEEEKKIFSGFNGANRMVDIEDMLSVYYETDEMHNDLTEFVNCLIEKGILIEKR